MIAGNVADDHRDAAERRECRRLPADADLQAAVDGVPRADLVNRSSVDGRHSGAVWILTRKPEPFEVRIPFVRHGRARGNRNEMLREMRCRVAGADCTDTVIDVDVTVPADVGAG